LVSDKIVTSGSDDIGGGIACRRVSHDGIVHNEAGILQDGSIRAVGAEDGVVN